MENVSITFGDVLYFLGLVITAGGAQAVISRWLSPARKFKQTVEDKVDKSAFEELKAKGYGGIVTNITWGDTYLNDPMEFELMKEKVQISLRMGSLEILIYER